jgi:hypothetical protein
VRYSTEPFCYFLVLLYSEEKIQQKKGYEYGETGKRKEYKVGETVSGILYVGAENTKRRDIKAERNERI